MKAPAMSKGYMEMQSRVRSLNCFRSAMQVQAAPAAGGGATGGDSAAFTLNSAEDFALAPVFGLDRREIAETSFVHGTEEYHFHKALVTLHALQRLRRRGLLVTSTGLGAGGEEAASAGGVSPRSSAFTWDLVETAPEAGWAEGEDLTEPLPDIAEEPSGGGDQEHAEPEPDTLESLSEQFGEAIQSLKDLGTGKAKERAQRLEARFFLVAHDVASADNKEEMLGKLKDLCKVSFKHKPPNVPGGRLVENSFNDDTTAVTGISVADYAFENQLQQHVDRCVKDGRRQAASLAGRRWGVAESRCAAFWSPLTQFGRARLFALLAAQLAPQDGAGGGADTSAASLTGRPEARRHEAAVSDSASASEDSESSAWHYGRRASCLQKEEARRREAAVSDLASASEDSEAERDAALGVRPPVCEVPVGALAAEELLPVLLRGLEFLSCVESRDAVVKVLLAALRRNPSSRDELRSSVLLPGVKEWFSRFSVEERAHLLEAAPFLWACPEFVAMYLRVCAPPPASIAGADELLAWANEVSRILALTSIRHEPDRPLMSGLCVYALHHALVSREHAAWLERYGRDSTLAAVRGAAPVVHSVVGPVVVPRKHLAAYLALSRPPGCSPFVSGESRDSRWRLQNSPEQVWGSLQNVKAEDEEALVERLCFALAAGGDQLTDLNLSTQWAARVKAEALLVSGSADAGLNAMASQAYTKAKGDLVRLTERTEVEFEKCNCLNFDVGQPAEVLVRTKNCGALAVRIFEVDAWRYHVAHGKEVPSDLSLEGLEPNAEVVLSELQQLQPLRRNLIRLRLPFVERGGVYVLELIGNGVSCRALLHVGALHLVEVSRSLAGQSFAVYDKAWQHMEQAKVLVDGTEIESEGGVLTVPHVAGGRAGQWTKAVVCSGSLSGLFDIMRFDSQNWLLRGGFFMDDEQLVEGNTAALAVCRAQLFLNEERMSLRTLKSVQLQVSWLKRESGAYELGGQFEIVLKDEADYVTELEIPRGARGVKLELLAKLSEDREIQLKPSIFSVHGVADTPTIFDLHLRPGFELQALGRSGEAMAGRAVDLSLRSALSKDMLGPFKCKTDARGRISLGNLQGIVSLQATFLAHTSTGSMARVWNLSPEDNTWGAQPRSTPLALSVGAGPLRLPLSPHTTFSLREVCFQTNSLSSDLTHTVARESGTLCISGLPAGKVCRLELFHPSGTTSERLLLAAGKLTSDQQFAVVGPSLFEWRPEDLPPRIEQAEIKGGIAKLRVANAAPGARVHVVARRFWRGLDLGRVAAQMPMRLPSRIFPAHAAESSFLRTRRMGDVVRYVLERRPLVQCEDFTAPSLPCARTAPFPGICIHGESAGNTKWDVHGDAAGERVEARAAQAKQRPPPALVYEVCEPSAIAGTNVAFVEPSAVLVNVALAADGTAEVVLPAGGHAFVELLVVQPNGHACTVLTRADQAEPQNRDTRLMSEVLDPTRHYGEVHGSKVLTAGDVFELSTPSVSQMQLYDSLPQVFDALYALLDRSPTFKRFEYLKKWPVLSEKDKLDFYSRDACHELHLFLHAHDRTFFVHFVLPLLANRRRYGRLDRWLLQLQPVGEAAVALTTSCRLEQLLVTAGLADPAKRSAQLQSLARLIDEDAVAEARGTPLERRSKAYDVMLRPHAAQLASKSGVTPLQARSRGLLLRGARPGRSGGRPPMRQQMNTINRRSWNRSSTPDQCEAEEDAHECASQASYSGGSDDDDVMERAASVCCDEPWRGERKEKEAPNQVNPLFQNFMPQVEDSAWFCKAAQRVVERGWLAGSGGPKRGAGALWREVAAALRRQPSARWPQGFVSAAALEAGLHGGVSEALCALALLDLPFAPRAAPALSTDEARQVKVVKAAGASIVFYSMVREVDAPLESSPLLLTQELKSLGGNLLPRTSELLIDTVVEAEVLAVNCGSEQRELRLLLQCPEGAIPVGQGSFYTRSVDVVVPAFGSTTVSNHFYFPRPGSFRWFPAHALAEERLVAFETSSAPLTVVAARGAVDSASWRDVAARGSLEDVLGFLRKQTVLSDSELSCVAWRMRDRIAFEAILPELRLQMRYSASIWGYGFRHKDLEVIKEFLQMASSFQKLVGPRMESELLTTDALDGSIFSHCDFEGLVLSRAHTVGARRQNIEDADLRKAYREFLAELAYAPSLSLEDRLLLTNFMLLQDRVDEARVSFEPVKDVLMPRLAAGAPPPGPLQLQAAYHMAYLAFIDGGDLAQANLAVRAFGGAPWLTKAWRARFEALAKALAAASPQLVDSAAAAEAEAGAEAKGQEVEASLAIEEFDTKGHRVRLSRAGVRPDSMRLACYVVDVELTFSAAPFTGSSSAQDGTGASHVTAIAPTVSLPLHNNLVDPEGWVALPADVKRRQMVLEVTATSAAGDRRLSAVRPCYYCDAKVKFDEKEGLLVVEENGRPAAGVYVKVFAGTPQAPRFYKDGYTDCIGTFDYVSSNAARAPFRKNAKLAVLVLSRKSGALVREVNAPPMQRSDVQAPAAVGEPWPAEQGRAPSTSSSSYDGCGGEGEESECEE